MKLIPVRMQADVHAAVMKLRAEIAQKGWGAFRVKRPDPPTISSIIEEAVRKLRAAAR